MSKYKKVGIYDRSVLTPLGDTLAKNIQNIIAGHSAISQVDKSRFGVDFPVNYCGEIDWMSLGYAVGGNELRSTFAIRRLLDQIESLSYLPKLDKLICLLVGVSLIDLDRLAAGGKLKMNQNFGFFRNFNFSEFLTSQLRFRGIRVERKDIIMLDNTCTSGNCAIGFAAQGIWTEQWESVLALSLDFTDHFNLVALNGLGALSKLAESPATASRPFDKKRDGFVKSDGAGIALICSESFAQSCGLSSPPIEVLGFSQTADAFRLTDGRDDVESILKAMRLAVERSHLNLKDISLVKAHGTSTQLNDRHEAEAIRKLFYTEGHHVPVTALKGHLGHVTDASGLVEALILGEALLQDKVLPILNCDDPEFNLDFVRTTREMMGQKIVLCNTLGFGGNNSCLVLSCL